ncbi:MAG TPA: PQQ-dependent sugar dehydrogenase [Thermoanaerobaculia bacterium]|nr:PQQ-dependent sugar dehydrogenase [Thermoanaerobaculia bacterium]
MPKSVVRYAVLAVLAAAVLAGSAVAQPAITLTPLGTGGVVSAPLHVASPHDGSGRIFVVSQEGVIKIFTNGAYLATPFLDITSLVTYADEQGLLSMAFHPSYATNGYFYVYYVDKLSTPGSVTIARYSVSAADPNVADPASAQIILVIPNPFDDTHRGGRLNFGPDGYLYAGIGDSGGVGDPDNRAQNKGSLFGKLLRIDVNGTGAIPCGQSTPMPYAIPPTNPFVGVSGACEEVWAYGFRNPWRYSFDRATGDLFIADVGEDSWEEVDLQPAGSAGGQNYGWRLMEGDHCYNPPTACNDGTLTLPIFEYGHTINRCAVIGGFRYRGTLIPDLVGLYVYGDLCTGEVFAASESGGTWSSVVLKDTSYVISGFGEDDAGELYLTNLSGLIYRLESTPYASPTLTALSPSPLLAGDPGAVLVATGSGFAAESVVRWNGAARPTAFVSTSELHATLTAADIAQIGTADVSVFTPAPGGGTSATLPVTIDLPFLDVPPGAFARDEISAVFNAHVTAGCGEHVYCPTSPVTRAQMAVFLLKASLGSGYVPPPATGMVFADVAASDFAAAWIEDLYARGITGGCATSPLRYCPTASVTRAQMAVFLLKAEHGASYVPPACSGTFADVPCPSLFADWVEKLAAEGVTAGCGNGNYCPDSAVTRAQMAVFLTKTFNLPIP